MSKRARNAVIGLVAALAAILAIVLYVLNSGAEPGPLPPASSATATVSPSPTQATPMLNGTWKSDDPKQQFVATVKDGTITIVWNMDENTHGLYWKGSFALDDTDGTILSKADRTALDQSIVASQDATKKFTYDGQHMAFEFGAMGVTKTVSLRQ